MKLMNVVVKGFLAWAVPQFSFSVFQNGFHRPSDFSATHRAFTAAFFHQGDDAFGAISLKTLG